METIRRVLFRLLWAAVAVLLVTAFAAYVWPTLYRYDHVKVEGSTYPVRINRLNGDADMLVPDQGWVPVEGDSASPNVQENTKAGPTSGLQEAQPA